MAEPRSAAAGQKPIGCLGVGLIALSLTSPQIMAHREAAACHPRDHRSDRTCCNGYEYAMQQGREKHWSTREGPGRERRHCGRVEERSGSLGAAVRDSTEPSSSEDSGTHWPSAVAMPRDSGWPYGGAGKIIQILAIVQGRITISNPARSPVPCHPTSCRG